MPERKFFNLRSGYRIAALDWGGSNPLAILCHANGFCAATWSLVAELLREEFRVVALDTRGHGASSTPLDENQYDWRFLVEDLLEVTNQLLASSAAPHVELLAGNSLGAVIGATAAAWEPEKFRAVVMLDPPVLPAGKGSLSNQIPKGTPNIAEQTRRRRRTFKSRDDVAKAYRRKKTFADWREQTFEHYLQDGFSPQADGGLALRCPPEVEAAIFERTGSIDLFAEAKHVQAAVTLVHAKRGMFPYTLYQRLIEQFSQGSLSSIDGGHLLPMELPEETAQLLLNSVAAMRAHSTPG